MYDIISQIINHNWATQTTGDQQIIYYICGALIIVTTACIFDLVYRIFSHFWR